jgi:ABC-type Fe3+-hydroxamate transport system substrate-binding protein
MMIMLHRMLLVFLVTLALTMGALGCQGSSATHQGKVVGVGEGSLTMTDSAGTNQHTHEVAANVVITCGGQPCGLADVKVGDTVTVTTDTKDGKTMATKIEVTRAG